MDLPRYPRPDASLALLREGYLFVTNGCERLGTDAFRTRLMLRPVVCMRGREAAEVVYDGDRVTRRDAMPPWVLRLLQGEGSGTTLSGEEHHRRKRLFLQWLGPGRFDPLIERMAAEYRAALPGWRRKGRIELLAEMRLVMVRAGCRWAGLPVDGDGPGAVPAERVRRWFAAMLGNLQSFGLGQIEARRMRREADRWVRGHVERVRARRPERAPSNLLEAFALHREPDGSLLPVEVVGRELFNVLRPTFAIARYVVFAANALVDHPHWRDRLLRRPGEIRPFVQEVRRISPFFPFIGGIALAPMEWRGVPIETGTWMLFDIYGTDMHPALWPDPERFDPMRFSGPPEAVDPYAFVPQGGGDHESGHRCAGEWVTIEAMVRLVDLLVRETAYAVPPQDRSIRLDRFPAGPASGFLIEDVRPVAAPALAAVK